ncbi:MAG: S8 family peptidase [Candidatus Rokuibacteriota bacterium]
MAERKQPDTGSGRRTRTGKETTGEGAGSDAARDVFDPKILDRTVIAIPLLNRITRKSSGHGSSDEPEPWDVIIDLNLLYPGGRLAARQRVERLVAEAIGREPLPGQGIHATKSRLSHQYIFARLGARAIQGLVRADGAGSDRPDVKDVQAQMTVGHAIYRIWPDFPVERMTTKSISTVKADAAHNAFSALGDDVTWAVMDSGIDGTHPHFARYKNLELEPPLRHYDFTVLDGPGYPLVDVLKHGTHVAAIIGGAREADRDGPIEAETRFRDEADTLQTRAVKVSRISGMAPRCKLVSLKVLDDKGHGAVSNLIAAIETIQEINGYGRRIRIHGVNLSVGYDFEPEWFACGQSPLCVEVDRLVRSGVVVVVAAGNTGYGWNQSTFRGAVAAGMDLTINDPGNAELAITVGSTHREMPHMFGVSYFSSKGPTGDGRRKPDLVAPGEKIISAASCGEAARAAQPSAPPPPPVVQVQSAELAASVLAVGTPSVRVGAAKTGAEAAAPEAATPARGPAAPPAARYREDSGTSMAAPHVSGAIAAFLSIRREFIGQPEAVKRIFLDTATDLKRDSNFQGRGMVDLMRAIQSV